MYVGFSVCFHAGLLASRVVGNPFGTKHHPAYTNVRRYTVPSGTALINCIPHAARTTRRFKPSASAYMESWRSGPFLFFSVWARQGPVVPTASERDARDARNARPNRECDL